MNNFAKNFEQLLARSNTQQRRHPADLEHKLQRVCVQWFRLVYPQFRHNLFAVPNGGRRDQVTGARMKAEGVLPGVADLILLKKSGEFGALLIEMKTVNGRLSSSQQEWRDKISQDGYKYVVCRSLYDFAQKVSDYLK